MSIQANALSDLRAQIQGRLITPQDADYDAARVVFYGGIDRRPGVVVRVASAHDVARSIAWAGAAGVELAIRSGGHSVAGHSLSEGGAVIDLRELKGLEIDAERRTAWADAGLTASEYTLAASAHDLATGFGDTGSVGLGGLTLGGGVGYLVRKHGLTIDSLLGAELVTASGEILHVDALTHPDLFWAIRGGGGNFGVVTRFQFRLHPVPECVGGILILPATPGTIASFLGEAQAAPDELSTIANVMPAPPMPMVPAEMHGRLVLFAILAFTGDADAGGRALAPFRKLATPIADLVRPIRYPELYFPDDESCHPTAAARTLFIDSVDRQVAEVILDRLETSDASMRVVQLRALGGAMARVPVEATAFAHRQSRIMANVAAFYEGPQDRPQKEAWVSAFEGALRQQDRGTYVNFLGDEGPAQVRNAYPASTWDRLVAVKQRYDPDNRFHVNQNIPPRPDAPVAR